MGDTKLPNFCGVGTRNLKNFRLRRAHLLRNIINSRFKVIFSLSKSLNICLIYVFVEKETTFYSFFLVLKILPGHQLSYSCGGGAKLFLGWVGHFLGGNGNIPKFLWGGEPTPNDTMVWVYWVTVCSRS